MWTATRRSSSRTAAAAPIAVILLLVMAAIGREASVVSIALFALILCATAYVWTGRVTKRIEVVRRYPDHIFQDEEAHMEVSVRNGSRLPIPWLRVSESISYALGGTSEPTGVVHLHGFGEHVLRYRLCPHSRGVYPIGPLSIELGDLLGIRERQLVISESESIVVYPRIVPLDRLGLPARSPLATLPVAASLIEDTSRMVSVRDYRQGDSLRRMHWAASAQLGRPQVKQFQPAVGRPTLLCLDLDPYDYSLYRWRAVEQAIVVAASLAYHIILREGQPVGLVTQGMGGDGDAEPLVLPPSSTHAHLLSLLDCLARIRIGSDTSLADPIRGAISHLPAGSSVICVTGRPGDSLTAVLLQARRRGHAVSLVSLDRSESTERRATMAGIPVHRVRSPEDLGVLR